MAVNPSAPRRPAPPRLRPGRPGVFAARPVAPVPARASAPVSTTPGSATQASTAASRPGRRTVLLLGSAAAALAVPVGGLALWSSRRTTGDPAMARTLDGAGADVLQASVASFPDVPADHPAAESIAWAHATGVQPGLDDGTYRPETELTRGDLVLALHRLAGAPAVDTDTTPALLTDVPSDPERAAAVLWLHGRGALWGDAELRVHPDAPVTARAGAGVLADLLVPALTAAVGEVAPALQPVLSTFGGSFTDPAADDAIATSTGLGADIDDIPLTRAHLALALHQVELALTS